MDYKFWSLAFGLSSILAFQAEQQLRIWMDDWKKERPIYRGNSLEVAARLSEKLKAHEKTVKNVVPCISVFRWSAVALGIVALFFGA